ncbi:MAG: ATP-binding protein [Actinomycetota bacterium]
MRTRGWTSWRRILAAALFVSFAGAAALVTLRPELGDSVGIAFMLVGYLVAGWLFVRGSRTHEGREGLAWLLIGIAFFLGATGILAFGAAAGLGYGIPAFGPLDIFFILAYLTNLAGFWTLPHLQGGPIRRARIFLDGLVGSVSLAVVAWVWLLSDYFTEIRLSSPWEVVIGTTYPLVDIATLVLVMVVTLRRSSHRFDPRILLLGAGFVAQALADLLYLNQGLGQSFDAANPHYAVFLIAVSCFVGAGLLLDYRPPAREYAERRTPWWAMVAPYGAALGMIVMLVVRMWDQSRDMETVELLVGAVLVVVLIVLRQTLAIRETRELVERQRSALVSSISHELRTPLTAMVGFLDILSDPDQGMTEDARQEVVGIVTQQAGYMARIVSDLVMLNRHNPDVPLEERTVEVRSVVSSAISSLDLDAGAGIVTEVPPDLAARLDPDRIHQVLVNLLTNAARYGGPNRMVAARQMDGDLVLEVHDDGPGVPKRYEYIIWDRFERGVHRYDAGTPGSGIGLAVVAMLAEAHGGTVGYRRSERLGGACFTVTLPGRIRRTAREEPLQPAMRSDS